jgi:uncharacterized membrane protein
MDNNNPPQSAVLSTPAWLKCARMLLAIAMLAAGYLAWVAIHNGPAAGCGAGSGCNAVLQSRWAYWLGVPVSVPAFLVYVALFGSTLLLQKRSSPDDQRGSWAAIIVLSVVIVGSAFWFVSLQIFVIQSFCKYCLTAHICGFAAALLCLTNIPYATEPDTPMWSTGSGKWGVPRRAMVSLLLVGLTGIGVLAGGQLLVQKERNVVKVAKAATAPVIVSSNTNQSSAQTGVQPAEIVPSSPNAQLIAPRTLSLYSNEFLIKFDDVPMLGSRDAPHVIVCLLDYTCSHCRALYPILVQMSQQFSNQLGVVCLPVSLSPKCNPYIPSDFKVGPEACEYARLGLAVWHAKPEVHRQFNDWLFADVKAPPLDQAREYAAKLVGADKLNTALGDKWVEQQLQTDCKIHRANWLAVDNSAMPQIVMGDAVSSGPINSVGHLQLLLHQYLGLNLGWNGM